MVLVKVASHDWRNLDTLRIDEQHLPLTLKPATAVTLFDCSKLRRLTVDMMDGSNIIDLVAIMDTCPGLKYLSYNSRRRNANNVSTQCLQYTQGASPIMTDIECLDITNQFHPADFIMILRRCPYLRYLDVHGIGLQKVHLNTIIDTCPLLESVQHSTRHRLSNSNTKLLEWWNNLGQRRYISSMSNHLPLRELVFMQASEGTLFYQAGAVITRHSNSLRSVKLSQRAVLCSKDTYKRSVTPQSIEMVPSNLEELEYNFPGPVSTPYQHTTLLLPLLQARKTLTHVSIALSTPLSSWGLDALARCEKLRTLCIKVPNPSKDIEQLLSKIARYGHPLEILDYSCTILSSELTSALAKVRTLRHVCLGRFKADKVATPDLDPGTSIACLCRSSSLQSLSLNYIPFDYNSNRVWQYISGISNLKSLTISTSTKINNEEGIRWVVDRQPCLDYFSLTGVWNMEDNITKTLKYANSKIPSIDYKNMNNDNQ
ncbi:hypothetical protein K492DRAFT_200449 [Lichtheimia hyalospora FSU 10163]|nr:hypothetical protein K492DRAFT_200449 [Lichtheimia hyalospora FSU 10163]